MNPRIIIAFFAGGLVLAGLGFAGLKRTENGLKYHQNPFAIQQSGYGKTLARLSQNTIDVVWHLGIEQVNPLDHDHHEEEHGHAEAPAAGGDHGDHADHDHGDHADHSADAAKPAAAAPGWVAEAREWMHDLGIARYNRNSPFAVTRAHQQAVAADIEKMLLRSYKMDPTDYGVYNGYFLFLTIHEFGGTPAKREHARTISRMTIAEAMKESTDPQPWLTAAMAIMNLFFMEQEDLRKKGQEPPVAMLEEFSQRMDYTLHRFNVLREEAKVAGRWETISEERRESMRERERFARMAGEQFTAMLARAQGRDAETPAVAPAGPEAPVSASNEKSESNG